MAMKVAKSKMSFLPTFLALVTRMKSLRALMPVKFQKRRKRKKVKHHGKKIGRLNRNSNKLKKKEGQTKAYLKRWGGRFGHRNSQASPVGKGDGNEGGQEQDELFADIFGSSDEDEEFEGFDASEVPKKEKKKKSAIKSDDENEDGATGIPDDGVVDPDAGADSDENLDELRKDGESGMFVSDFDLMMAKKKEEMQKQRRKRKDVDLINDNDDLIADLIVKMKEAANMDRELNQKRQLAINKIRMLTYVINQLKKSDLHGIFLESGILGAITEWLAPLPDKSLPHLNIREQLLQILQQFPALHSDLLKSSGIGKAIMYLFKHPKETKNNKIIAGKLINEWSRPIFSLTSNYKNLSREEREQRDYDQLPKRRRTSLEGGQTPRRDIDKALAGEKKALRPGDPGWVYRARVPMPSNRDYVVRPTTSSEYQPPAKGASKKKISRYERHKRSFLDKKRLNKTQKAVGMSIEGRNMEL
ncbi:protein iws1 homolog [Plakobranchus ocellatus]|uniref:Protein iws1 homolog n=1 Tax=Plakobranchus ocellatus TaxID=259542 RepID=A0AAV3ZW38_9GAST|nr:protein iws1 homolog [Plakobranchus ocellatus]